MNITANQIKSSLDHLGIIHQWRNNTDKQYIIASLFAPVDDGFYFYIGTKGFPFNIQNSIILVPGEFEAPVDSKNTFIYITERDTQECYYHILSLLYKRVSNGKIAPSSIIHQNAKIGKNVQIDDFCIIEDCIIEDDVIISSHTKIHANTVIGKGSIIESMCIIGTQGVAWVWDKDQSKRIIQPQLGGVQIGCDTFLGANTIIVRGSLNEDTRIGNNVLMAPGGRLGHGTFIDNFVHLANNVVTGGNTYIGKYSFVGSAAVFRPKVKVHSKTIVGAGSVVIKDTSAEKMTLVGVPAKEIQTNENPSGMPKPKK